MRIPQRISSFSVSGRRRRIDREQNAEFHLEGSVKIPLSHGEFKFP